MKTIYLVPGVGLIKMFVSFFMEDGMNDIDLVDNDFVFLPCVLLQAIYVAAIIYLT